MSSRSSIRSRCCGWGSLAFSSRFLTIANASESSHSTSAGFMARPSRQRPNVWSVRRNASSRKCSRQSCSLARADGIELAQPARRQPVERGAFITNPNHSKEVFPRSVRQRLSQLFCKGGSIRGTIGVGTNRILVTILRRVSRRKCGATQWGKNQDESDRRGSTGGNLHELCGVRRRFRNRTGAGDPALRNGPLLRREFWPPLQSRDRGCECKQLGWRRAQFYGRERLAVAHRQPRKWNGSSNVGRKRSAGKSDGGRLHRARNGNAIRRAGGAGYRHGHLRGRDRACEQAFLAAMGVESAALRHGRRGGSERGEAARGYYLRAVRRARASGKFQWRSDGPLPGADYGRRRRLHDDQDRHLHVLQPGRLVEHRISLRAEHLVNGTVERSAI